MNPELMQMLQQFISGGGMQNSLFGGALGRGGPPWQQPPDPSRGMQGSGVLPDPSRGGIPPFPGGGVLPDPSRGGMGGPPRPTGGVLPDPSRGGMSWDGGGVLPDPSRGMGGPPMGGGMPPGRMGSISSGPGMMGGGFGLPQRGGFMQPPNPSRGMIPPFGVMPDPSRGMGGMGMGGGYGRR